MRKLFIAALIIAASFSLGLAQEPGNTSQNLENIVRLARAPQQPDGIGRAVVIVKDENGNPIPGAFAKLESVWGGDNFCESWSPVNENGAAALPPIHMGRLKLNIKAKGYQTLKMDVNASSLSEPVEVTLVKKR
jgi:hypothetical protein